MKRLRRYIGSGAMVSIAFSLPASANLVIDTVMIGNIGNANDGSGYGGVSYAYRIGKNETTISQYVVFLNAMAKTDPYGLYSTYMASDTTIAGISRSGSNGSYLYSVIGSTANKPITNVSWFDAARFCNWLHNGQGSGSTETGAYTLINGQTTGIVALNSGAKVWIPTENEWYKAAYYDATKGGTGGYWSYPNRSNDLAGNTIGVAGAANYYFGGYVGSPVRLTDVGAYGPNSVSYYGTNDQGGNVMEWTDAISAYDSMRIPRGGSWNDNLGYFLRSTSRDYYVPLNGYSDYTGFRIASVYVFSPIEIWLQSKGFPFDTDIKSDHNNDGVNILMAYALNLDPNLNLSGEMPRPVNTPDHDSLSFYAAASGVTYTVETSTDLQHWTTEGVSLSDLKANSITATVKRDGANRFMRLVVSK